MHARRRIRAGHDSPAPLLIPISRFMASLPRPAVALAVALAPLVLALGAQYGLGIRPCFLCHLQRLPWIGLALLAATVWARPSWERGVVVAAWGLIAVGVGLAGWHFGVEEGWFLQPSACRAAASEAASAEELLRQIQAAPPPCGQQAWSPTGIPWPAMNALALAAAGVLLWRGWR